jgi:hypothetical protein
MALNHEDLDDIWHSHLPALEHLEFWLERTLLNIRNFTPLFSGELFPHLRHLTIYLCQFADELAMALAASPLLQRLKVLDLSLGNFSDRGAAALLASPAFRHLEKLKVQHYYCSDKVVRQLQALPMDVEITDQQQWHSSFAAGRGPIAHWDCYD